MDINFKQSIVDNFIQVISLVGAILLPFIFLFMVWAIQRGLNVTDESMSLVSSQTPADVRFGLTSAYLYTSYLFHGVGQNVIAFRFVRLVMSFIAGAVFYVGLNRFISEYQSINRQTILVKTSIISLLILGSMFQYTWFEPSPYYNTLNSFALTVSSGLFLLLYVESKVLVINSSKTMYILLLIGLCIGVSLFVKLTTGLLLLSLYFAFIGICTNQTINNKLRYLLIIITGLLIWIILHFTIIQSPVLWWRYFSNGLQLATAMSAGYDASSLVRYFHEFVSVGKRALYDFWALHVIILLVFNLRCYYNKLIKNNIQLISILLGIVFAAAVALSIYRHLYVGGQSQVFNLSRFYLSWLLLLFTAVIASIGYYGINGSIMSKQKLLQLFLVGILLFCLPFAGAIGTGGRIYLGVLMHMAPWFGLLLLLVTLLSWLHQIKWIAPVMCVVFSLFACSQIATGCLLGPYQLLTGLTGQTQTTEIGYPPTKLKLDPMTSAYFTQVKELAHKNGFKPGNDILALHDMPGVVFALGGRSPAFPWYFGNPRKSPVAVAEIALSIADPERLKHAFILQTSKSDRIMPDFSKFGLDFPSGYVLCGEVKNPYDAPNGTVRLWKPR